MNDWQTSSGPSQDEPLNAVPVPQMADLSQVPLSPFDCLSMTEPLEPEAIPMHLAMLTIAVAELRRQLEAVIERMPADDGSRGDGPGGGSAGLWK